MAAKKKTTKKAKKCLQESDTNDGKETFSEVDEEKTCAEGGRNIKRVAAKKQPGKKSESVDQLAFSPEGGGSRSGGQSGDLQGLSRLEAADWESVDQLIQEGNAFEADLVAVVERADNTDEQEVRRHEVPKDDVPGEYLDKE
jgi:hypothetical protein